MGSRCAESGGTAAISGNNPKRRKCPDGREIGEATGGDTCRPAAWQRWWLMHADGWQSQGKFKGILTGERSNLAQRLGFLRFAGLSHEHRLTRRDRYLCAVAKRAPELAHLAGREPRGRTGRVRHSVDGASAIHIAIASPGRSSQT